MAGSLLCTLPGHPTDTDVDWGDDSPQHGGDERVL